MGTFRDGPLDTGASVRPFEGARSATGLGERPPSSLLWFRPVIPGIATPPRPKIGCGAVILGCSNCVGSCASCCGACLLRRGPVARPPMKAASDIGVAGDEAVGGGTKTPLSPMSFRSEFSRSSRRPTVGVGVSATVDFDSSSLRLLATSVLAMHNNTTTSFINYKRKKDGDIQRSTLVPRPVLLRMRASRDAAISCSSRFVSASSSSSTCFCSALILLVHSARPASGFGGVSTTLRRRVARSPRSMSCVQRVVERVGITPRGRKICVVTETFGFGSDCRHARCVRRSDPGWEPSTGPQILLIVV